MNIANHLITGLEKELGEKLNPSQIQIIREVAKEYDEQLKESLDLEIESLVGRIKTMKKLK